MGGGVGEGYCWRLFEVYRGSSGVFSRRKRCMFFFLKSSRWSEKSMYRLLWDTKQWYVCMHVWSSHIAEYGSTG